MHQLSCSCKWWLIGPSLSFLANSARLTPAQADCLKTKNALLREELNRAQALESQLKGQLAQVQKDTAAMDQSNADMRTTVACLRQRGVSSVGALVNGPETCLHHGRCVHMTCPIHHAPLLLQAPLQPPGSPIGTMLPLPSSFRYCIDFLVQPDTPYEGPPPPPI